MSNEFDNNEEQNAGVQQAQPQQPKQQTSQKFGNPIVLIAIIAAFGLMFLSGFLVSVIDNFNADRIIAIIFNVLIFGCIALAFTFILLNYRKTGKTVFTIELILALLALLVFFV